MKMAIFVRLAGDAALYVWADGEDYQHVGTFVNEDVAKDFADVFFGCDPDIFWNGGIF